MQTKNTDRQIMPFTRFFIGYNFCLNRISINNSQAVAVIQEVTESPNVTINLNGIAFILFLIYKKKQNVFLISKITLH